jgi:RsiW-degrading membrane proteinase PrsW (M82 family)
MSPLSNSNMMPLALPYFLENARDLEIIGIVLGLIFWYQMLRLCAARERNSMARFLWIVFMIVAPGIGSLIYFLLRVVGPRT